MNWDKNQGPWGSNTPNKPENNKPESLHAWTRRNGGGGNGGGEPPFNMPPPPDLKEIWNRLKDFFSPYKPQGHFQAVMMGVSVLVAIWLFSGIYMVAANQVGVVMRFGAFNHLDQPGLRYHLPAPIEEALTPVVTAQNEIQIGFRNATRGGEGVYSLPEESMMLTQDENVINVQFTVFWRVADVNDYLFQIRNPEVTVKMAAESAMREAIGQNKLQFALTEGRAKIAEEARTRLQELIDEYKAGIVVTQINLQTVAVPTEVKAAFQDVVNARLDMERFQNQAAAHVNKVIPDAKGQAAKLLQEAMAYRDQKIAVAKGDADRFKEVLMAYNMSKDVTTKRIYLETMESILGSAQKIVTDKSAGTFPMYPLQDMMRKNQPIKAGTNE
ncbi:MAG: FtsH protease activity modulator HflK [Alphaproteobacteria bacterium]|nr:FtsH protease activity modulator HflK [Alphaproteobacteria bacterium]